MSNSRVHHSIVRQDLQLNKLLYYALLLAALNFLAISFLPTIPMRSIRLLTTVFFLTYYSFFIIGRNRYVLAILLLLLVRDVFYVFYWQGNAAYYFFLFSILSYGFLLLKQWRRLAKIEFISPSLVVGVLLAMAFIYLITCLKDIIAPGLESTGVLLIFYVFGSFIVVTLLSALYYYYRVGSRRSICFGFLVFNLMVTDVAFTVAYYTASYNMYYLERLTYIGALVLLLHYGLNTKLLNRELQNS